MKKNKKKIIVVTSSRADYGLLKNLIKKLFQSKKIKLHLSVTGTHLSLKHGKTINEILRDKVSVHSKIKIVINDSPMGISKAFSQSVVKFSELFIKQKPDLILILGDRFEILASVIAATLNRIPIAHVHGGEETVGAIDNVIRHSITKMAHVHFASINEYKKRIIQMGENPNLVFNVGAVGLEELNKYKFKTNKYFKKNYNIDFKKKSILVCFHPVTLEPFKEQIHIRKILLALKNLKDTNIIFTSPNADQGNNKIEKEIIKFSKGKKNCFYIRSFGRSDFLSCLRLSNLMIGNSSSGIFEAPSLKTISINLGDRQQGRIKSKSVIDTHIDSIKIEKLIKKFLYKKVAISKNYFYNPYFKKDVSNRIIKVLENLETGKIIKKNFFNII